jgi:anti-anti-sigma factor
MSLPLPLPLPSDGSPESADILRIDCPRVELSCPSASLAVVEFVGEHDLGQYAPIREALRLASARRRHVLVDLSNCAFIDSTVVGLLLVAQDEVTSDGGRFALILPHLPSPVAKAAQMMGLVEMFETYSKLEDALASTEHITRVRDLRARFGDPDRFSAECCCGWQGAARTGVLAMRTARNDASNHAHTRAARIRSGRTTRR